MLFSVDKKSEMPVYEQINFAVKAAISARRINPGEQLPSIREVAVQLDVNPNTVAKAFRDLETLKYVYTRRGMGVFIADGAFEMGHQECAKIVRSHIQMARDMCKAAGISWHEMIRDV